MQIEINNLKINYEKLGPDTKTNVVLLHGWGTNIKTWGPVLSEISKKLKTYAIDFPGFGESDKPDESYTVEDYSKIVYEFINRLNLEHVILVGHSFGGRVIIKLVGKLGYKPDKIILVDSAGIKPKKKIKTKLKELTFKFIKKCANLFLGKAKAKRIIDKYKNKMGSEDYKNADDTMKEVFKNVINEDLRQYLPNINVPTLLIWGDRDLDTPVADAKIMEELIPNAGLAIINGTGHFSFLENPNYFMIIVNKFLEGCE